jgi:hypothetical protein
VYIEQAKAYGQQREFLCFPAGPALKKDKVSFALEGECSAKIARFGEGFADK